MSGLRTAAGAKAGATVRAAAACRAPKPQPPAVDLVGSHKSVVKLDVNHAPHWVIVLHLPHCFAAGKLIVRRSHGHWCGARPLIKYDTAAPNE